MELSPGEIIQKSKMQELSSLFMTHRLNVMHTSVKIQEYMELSQGEIIQKSKMQELSSLLTLSKCDACTCKVS